MRTGLICLDVDGTVSDRFERPQVEGLPVALAELRAIAPVRFVTNATSRPHRAIAAALREQGLLDDPGDLVTPAASARRVLTARDEAAGLLLAEESSLEDFDWFRRDPVGPAVVLATEGHGLRIADLQPAFRRLLDGARLYALQRNRYFRQGDALVTDLGPVAAFLQYASGAEPAVLGKPSPLLFDALAEEAGCAREEIVMVGDDAEFDASQSVALGMRGVLVRTGKYRAGDENRHEPPPTATIGSVLELAAWLRG